MQTSLRNSPAGAPGRQFRPDRKEQQDDAEFAEQRDVFARRDGDVPQPRIIGGERAEPRWPDEQPDE